MRIEWLICFFMAICLMMMLFNGCYLVMERLRDRRFDRLAAKFEDELLQCGPQGEGAPASRIDLATALSRLSGMEAFDVAMQRAEKGVDAEALEGYLESIAPTFSRLSRRYDARPGLERAFFAYLVRRWYRARPAADSVIYCLQRDLLADSLYVRQNAFEAIARVGEADVLAHALETLDGKEEGHSPRLVTETLLEATCDAGRLATALDARLERLRPQTSAAVINYLRMCGMGSRGHLLALMESPKTDREIRLACVRYFMRNPDSRAESMIRRLAQSEDPASWEYAAVSAMALASYPGRDTVALLKGLLSSRNWFVRFNAAKSLYDLGCTLEGDLGDVLAGADRFAREMLVYRWQLEGSALPEGDGA